MATLLRKKALALMIAISGATPSAQAGYFEWIKENPLVSGSLLVGALVSARFVNRQAQEIQLHKSSLEKKSLEIVLKSKFAAMFLSNQTNLADFILGSTSVSAETGNSNFYGHFTVGIDGKVYFTSKPSVHDSRIVVVEYNQKINDSSFSTESLEFHKALVRTYELQQKIFEAKENIKKPCIII